MEWVLGRCWDWDLGEGGGFGVRGRERGVDGLGGDGLGACVWGFVSYFL